MYLSIYYDNFKYLHKMEINKYVHKQSRSPICMTCGRLDHAKQHSRHTSKSSIPGLVTHGYAYGV